MNSKHHVVHFEPRDYVFVTSYDHSWILDPEGEGSGEAADPIDPVIGEEANLQDLDLEHCSHCGSRLVRGSVFRHNDGDLAVFGETCAQRMGFNTHDEFAAARRERQIYIAGIRKLVRAKPEYAAVVKALQSVDRLDRQDADPWCWDVAHDMLHKASRFYGLSDKQIAFALTLPARNAEAVAKAKARAKAKAAIPALDSGRQHFKGEVVSVKERRSQWGIQWKMVVRNDIGQAIWCTVPSSMEWSGKGTIVEFSIDITPSDDDKTFGFGKRPTQVRVLAEGIVNLL